MNRLIISVGVFSALIWGFVTAMTFGLPKSFCMLVDRVTLHKWTREVHQMANGFYYDVNNNDMPTVIFLFLFGILFALTTLVVIQIAKGQPQKNSLGWIIAFAVLFRIILVPGELIHENDIYRYIWDGKTTLNKINPYKYAPIEVAVYDDAHWDMYDDDIDEYGMETKSYTRQDQSNLDALHELRGLSPVFYERIGHWEVPTIYPPVAQLLFALPVFVNGYSLILIKSFILLFDIANIFLIVALLNHFNKNPCMSIIYAWSPLVLFEIANRGHYDAIPIFFTLLSLLLLLRKKPMGGVFVLALATMSKFFSAVLLPLMMKPMKKRYCLLFAGVIGLFYLPFIFWDETGIRGAFEGFMTYNRQWSYNASIFAVAHIVLGKIGYGLADSLIPAKIVVGSLYLGIWAYLIVEKNKNELDMLHKCFWAVALLFIINPVADPWYFCWVIPFLCFFPYRSWYLLSGLLIISYLNFHSDIGITEARFWGIPLIGWIIYVPFFLILILENLMGSKTVLEEKNIK